MNPKSLSRYCENNTVYFQDLNGNKWEVDKYSYREARNISYTLINCINCINCEFCQDCINCISCTYSSNLKNCENISYSDNLKNCEYVYYSHDIEQCKYSCYISQWNSLEKMVGSPRAILKKGNNI